MKLRTGVASLGAALLVGLAAVFGATMASQRPANCPVVAQPYAASALEKISKSATDRGLLWEVERDGRKSYLYGSMHFGKSDWGLGPRTRSALAEAKVLALELDVLEPAIQAETMKLFAADRPTSNAALQKRVSEAGKSLCLTAEALSQSSPAMQVLTLTLLDGIRAGLQGAYGSEAKLATAARAQGASVVSLETAKIQYDAIIRGGGNSDQLLAESLDLVGTAKGERVLARMTNAWESGDAKALENMHEWCECMNSPEGKAFYKSIRDDRNPGLADGIDQLHSRGTPVFAAVGAYHMFGAQAIPDLLVKKGYKVTRVVFAK